MSYELGRASLKNLDGVKPALVAIVKQAILITEQDFCVYEGLRTYKQQMENVKKGVSQTMDSMHLKGLAVDLVPWVEGKPVWDWNRCYDVAWAMDKAATILGYAKNIRWGGVWDRRLSDFGSNESWSAYKDAVAEYQKRHPGKDFLDAPHFEWRD